MACSLPIVATDAQGLPDTLADGQDSGGLMVREDRPDEAAHALKRLKDDLHLRENLGRAAHKRIEENFSLAAVAAALDCLLTRR
ncbi:glycosyltransferase [Mesorhizobium sp.]|uniref:glycosyltransferase n=1 Tax=Mesorhizobium sp. TaxID=1871066 RepID=UPI000FE55D6E|nr:glycosyltransferase [Mesorhizobium sp.]RWP37067.1 MAG: glycosyltransferase [Mesorhizobium sp.]